MLSVANSTAIHPIVVRTNISTSWWCQRKSLGIPKVIQSFTAIQNVFGHLNLEYFSICDYYFDYFMTFYRLNS